MHEWHRLGDNHPTTVVVAFEHTRGQDVAAPVALAAVPIESHLHAYGLPPTRVDGQRGDPIDRRAGQGPAGLEENLRIPGGAVREGCRP